MNNSYRPQRNSSHNRGYRPAGRRYGRNNNSNYAQRRNYERVTIKHDQYVFKVTSYNMDSLYVKDKTFADFELASMVQRNIRIKGYVHPTKIQFLAIPEILAGKDILGMASTGSGKTAAFLLPMITKIIKNRNEKCLIVVPTRELANQIRQELLDFSRGTNIMETLIIGGANYGSQVRLLSRKPQFVIATPGRLIDLNKMGKINLRSFNNVVLDEVDQMLDMGFIKDIELIISNLAETKQSLFFSATMNTKAEAIARKLLKDPVKIQTEQQSPALNVEQNILKYKFNGEKIKMLHDYLINTNFEKVLVFSKTRKGADLIAKELQRLGHSSDAIHSDKSLGQRNRVIAEFRRDTLDILVATDIAARGIDIPNISHIINYDEPANYSDYIHRIGRTGRIGKKGFAITFVR